jgi:hypothetical protein
MISPPMRLKSWSVAVRLILRPNAHQFRAADYYVIPTSGRDRLFHSQSVDTNLVET